MDSVATDAYVCRRCAFQRGLVNVRDAVAESVDVHDLAADAANRVALRTRNIQGENGVEFFPDLFEERAAREMRGGRGEHVAAVERGADRGGHELGIGDDPRFLQTVLAEKQGSEAVVGTHDDLSAGKQGDWMAFGSDAGVDDGHVNRALREMPDGPVLY